ncbi:MAG: putative lipoprotein [Leptospirillum sp. Group IV 'UBA BS']|nr:MAG: putative lipoprotein [Leptospirillum sp. Group IV 'UBA BS']
MTLFRIGLKGLLFFSLLLLPGCGGGSSSSSSPTAVCTGTTPTTGLPSPTSNSMPVYQSTCAGTVNIPAVTLHICVPDTTTTTCEDVPNILLDYGSTGLRLSHTVAISGELHQETTGGGQGLFECYQFVSGYNFGPVVTAQITLGTNKVTVPVQISNSTLSAPSSCTNGTSSAPFQPYYNGILGVLFPQCDGGLYYAGSGGTPASLSCPTSGSQEVQNPVYLLSTGNNGVLLTGLPTVSPSTGASNVTGTLTFGISSSSNFTQLDTDQNGTITASYNGKSLTAYFDTGSNGYFIDNSSISQCSSSGNYAGFFCGNDPSQSAKLTGSSGSYTLPFSIVSAQTLFATGNNDFSSLGGYAPGTTFDAGFPAFLQGLSIGIGWGTVCSPGCFLIGQ